MIHPQLRRLLNTYLPPKKFVIERFDETTGLWKHVKTIPVNWPSKTVQHKFLWWKGHKVEKQVGDCKTISDRRHDAYCITMSTLCRHQDPRIVEVKSNGSEFTIYQNGHWTNYN